MVSSSEERAAFATTARLLSCLVTESLVRAIFVPCRWADCEGDVLAIILLINVPVIKFDSNDPRGKEIGLLDPLDMFPLVLAASGDGDVLGKEVWHRASIRFSVDA